MVDTAFLNIAYAILRRSSSQAEVQHTSAAASSLMLAKVFDKILDVLQPAQITEGERFHTETNTANDVSHRVVQG